MDHIRIIAQLRVLRVCHLAISLRQGHGLLIACEDLIGDKASARDCLLVIIQAFVAVLVSSAKGILCSLTTVIYLNLFHVAIILSCDVLYTLVLKVQLDCSRGFLSIFPFLTVCASGRLVFDTMRWRIDNYFTV